MLLTQVVWLSALCAMALVGGPATEKQSPAEDPSALSPHPPHGGNRCTSPASCRQQVRGIQNLYVVKWRWSDIGYNFLIGEDGRVYEGRVWSTMGAQTRAWNDKLLGFSFLGTFSNRAPNTTTLNAAKSLIQCAISKGFLSRSYTLKGHRNVNPTICPGDALYNLICTWPRFKA